MFEVWSRPLSTPGRLLGWVLLGPLLVPAVMLTVRLAAVDNAPALGPGWLLLGLLGPALPVYLVVLPLLPWALRGLARGKVLRLGPVLLGMATLCVLIDLLFRHGGR
jgi:hypothetical protein